MAKHPVPKYKTPKSKSRARYAAFKRKSLKKLMGIVNGRHHKLKKADEALKEGRKEKELDKIKKVKA